MKDKHTNFFTDLSFMGLLIVLFICVLYAVFTAQDSVFSVIALGVVFGVMMITHYTSATTGLVINVVLIFLYFSYLIYGVTLQNKTIEFTQFFWVVTSPVLTVLTALVFRGMRSEEKENQDLRQYMDKYAGWNAQTGLRNMVAFERNMLVYRNLAKENEKLVLLVVWQFRYEKELRRYLGESTLEELVIKLSPVFEQGLEKKEMIYFLSPAPYRWGTMILSHPDRERAVIERIKRIAEEVDIEELTGKKAPKLELRAGALYITNGEATPQELLDKAIAAMQQDV